MARRIYQLELSLTGSHPAVWRRLMVSANVTLRQAHHVLQKAMGPGGSNEYCFRQDGREFGRPDTSGVYIEDDSLFSLRYCLCQEGDILEYANGGWMHSVVLEAIWHTSGRFPWRLLDGAGVRPGAHAFIASANIRVPVVRKTRH